MNTLQVIETWKNMNEHQKLLCVQLWKEENEQDMVLDKKTKVNNYSHINNGASVYTDPVNRYLAKIYKEHGFIKLRTAKAAYEVLKRTQTGMSDIDSVERKTPASMNAVKKQISLLEGEGYFKSIYVR